MAVVHRARQDGPQLLRVKGADEERGLDAVAVENRERIGNPGAGVVGGVGDHRSGVVQVVRQPDDADAAGGAAAPNVPRIDAEPRKRVAGAAADRLRVSEPRFEVRRSEPLVTDEMARPDGGGEQNQGNDEPHKALSSVSSKASLHFSPPDGRSTQ